MITIKLVGLTLLLIVWYGLAWLFGVGMQAYLLKNYINKKLLYTPNQPVKIVDMNKLMFLWKQ